MENKDLSIKFLPSYSPELNPVERFFQEMRKVTANRIFENIHAQEDLIEQDLKNVWIMKKNLCGRLDYW